MVIVIFNHIGLLKRQFAVSSVWDFQRAFLACLGNFHSMSRKRHGRVFRILCSVCTGNLTGGYKKRIDTPIPGDVPCTIFLKPYPNPTIHHTEHHRLSTWV